MNDRSDRVGVYVYECGCKWNYKIPFCVTAGHGAPFVHEQEVKKNDRVTVKDFLAWVQEANERMPE